MSVVWSQYQINQSLISSGGVIHSSVSTLEVSGAVGEPVIGIMTANQYEISSGFWGHAALVVGIEDEPSEILPKVYELSQNYPNPFNPLTSIKYSLPYISQVRIDVFNVLGIRVNILIDRKQIPGYHVVEWDGKNTFGNPVSSGMYFYRIIAQANNGEVFARTMKMILLK
jgi:hypothetical protein